MNQMTLDELFAGFAATLNSRTELPISVQELIDAMTQAGGREVGGVWRPYQGMTITCTGVVTGIPDHAGCAGWTVPALDRRECWCPCHDAYRPPYEVARAAAEAALPRKTRPTST